MRSEQKITPSTETINPTCSDLIAIIGKEARCKYGIGPFRVIECLDGSGNIWFKDDLPYWDKEGNIIQSRCLPSECTTNPEEVDDPFAM